MAYVTAAYRFADWCEGHGLTLATVRPLHAAAYIEQLTHTYAAATVKQNLAGLRQLFDWLVVGQVILSNPATAVRGPKQVVRRHGGGDPHLPRLWVSRYDPQN